MDTSDLITLYLTTKGCVFQGPKQEELLHKQMAEQERQRQEQEQETEHKQQWDQQQKQEIQRIGQSLFERTFG